MLNKLLARMEIPKKDNNQLAKIIGKDRTIAQATRSEKRACSLGLHSFRHTNGTAMAGWESRNRFATNASGTAAKV
jgi:hypothetical protein